MPSAGRWLLDQVGVLGALIVLAAIGHGFLTTWTPRHFGFLGVGVVLLLATSFLYPPEGP